MHYNICIKIKRKGRRYETIALIGQLIGKIIVAMISIIIKIIKDCFLCDNLLSQETNKTYRRIRKDEGNIEILNEDDLKIK